MLDKVLSHKTLPTDTWPKLISLYDATKLDHVEGNNEGYEYCFRTNPKDALRALVLFSPITSA